ncbi:HNH endonuclease [Urbifossiella limnaea]|uniref:HNH endonuclease n=1 Tax=Urbifossiella limnaea TaxID=2528023 RepID=A0A517XT20_9BACT|nr:HNH endonuclease [Urbifossiella limnaea]QDU20641.1 HNH endonuclease [Urbifossiella limnaea]
MPPPKPPEPCRLCGRPFPPDRLTKHHCKPKAKGGTTKDVELVCSQCHGMVHATFTNTTLAVLYPTIDQLRTAPELGPFRTWVRKQPPSRRKRNKERRRKV